MALKLPPLPTGVLPGSFWWNDWYEKMRTMLNSIAGSYVPSIRRINTTAPLSGGGDLSADLTLSVSGLSPKFSIGAQGEGSGVAAAGTVATAATALATGSNILVFVRYEATTTTTAVTDTAGNTYTALTQFNSPGGAAYGRLFYCLNATGNAANVVTCTFGANRAYRYIQTIEFLSTSAASFDVEATSNSGTEIQTVGPFSTTAEGIIFAGAVAYNSQSFSMMDSGVTVWRPSGGVFSTLGYVITREVRANQRVSEIGPAAGSGRGIGVACFK